MYGVDPATLDHEGSTSKKDPHAQPFHETDGHHGEFNPDNTQILEQVGAMPGMPHSIPQKREACSMKYNITWTESNGGNDTPAFYDWKSSVVVLFVRTEMS